MKLLHITFAAAAIIASSAYAAPNVVKVDLSNDAITFSPAVVRAGKVTFQVTNDSVDDKHEMVVVKTPSADGSVPFDTKKDRVVEAKLTSMGEVSKLSEGESKTLEATLAPGTYVLLCNYKGHYRHGMHTVLTVQ